MTTFELLLKRYPPSGCALLSEVSDAAGASRGRSIDFMVMNLWPSRGLSLTGIERKSFRNDWLREIKNPAKQESIIKYCDYFYLLTDGNNVAKIEEIPVTWGWMEVDKGKIVVRKEAPKLQAESVSKHFLAALLKRANSKDGYIPRDSISDQIEIAKKQAIEAYQREKERNSVYMNDLKEKVRVFEEESGISFGRWPFDVKKVAAAIKFLAKGGLVDMVEDMKRARNSANVNLSNLDKTLNELAWVKKEVESEL